MRGDQTQASIAGCYIEERNLTWTLKLLILSMEDKGVTIQFKNTEKKCWAELKLVCWVLTVTSESRVKSNFEWLQLLKVFYIRGMWGSEHAAVQRRNLCVLDLEHENMLLYVPLGGVHFKAVGSMVLPWPRLVSFAFQSSIRSYRKKLHVGCLHSCRAKKLKMYVGSKRLKLKVSLT